MPELSDLKLELHRKFNAILDEIDAAEKQTEPETPADPVEKTADTDHHHTDTSHTVYAAPDSNQENILKALADRFKRGIRPGQSVLKAADGRRLMLIVTSNSYQDREGETLKSDALKEDVDRHWTGEDAAFMTNNKLLYWHDDDVVLGDIVWADMVGPFYTEVAVEAATPIAKKYFDWREAHPEEKWGASHRFAYFTKDRTPGGDFGRIFKRETSTLPLKEAANIGTLSEVIPMSDKRAKKFDEMLGIDGALNILKTEGYDALVKRLQSAGVEHKSHDETPDVPIADTFARLVVDMADDMAQLDERIEKALGELATQQKAYTDKSAELADAIKAVNTLADDLQARKDAAPKRASQDSSTVITNAELTKEVADLMMVDDPVFGKVYPKSGA